MMEGQPYTDFVSDIHTHGLRDGMNLRKLKQPHNRIHTLDHFLDAHSLYGDQRDRARDWR